MLQIFQTLRRIAPLLSQCTLLQYRPERLKELWWSRRSGGGSTGDGQRFIVNTFPFKPVVSVGKPGSDPPEDKKKIINRIFMESIIIHWSYLGHMRVCIVRSKKIILETLLADPRRIKHSLIPSMVYCKVYAERWRVRHRVSTITSITKIYKYKYTPFCLKKIQKKCYLLRVCKYFF